MKKIVHNIRKKPEHVRRHILYAASIFLTAIVFLFWVLTFSARISSPEAKESFKRDLEPLSALKDDISGAYYEISSSDRRQ